MSSTENTLIPSLTKETWEYLEYRMWSSFSKKLWSLVGAILTVSALLGVLGMNAWVKYQISQAISSEKEKFNDERVVFLKKTDVALARSIVLSEMQGRLNEDRMREIRQREVLHRDVTDEEWKALTSDRELAVVTSGFGRALTDDGTKFHEKLRSLRTKEKVYMDHRVQGLRSLMVQNQAIEQGIAALRRSMIDDLQLDRDSVAHVYQSKFYPIYEAAMKELGGPTMFYSAEPDAMRLLSGRPEKAMPIFYPDRAIGDHDIGGQD